MFSRAVNRPTSLVAGLALAIASVFATAASAADLAPPMEYPSITAPAAESGLQFHNPFAACEMNCMATIYVGKYVKTPMSDIYGLTDVKPWWNWKSKDSWLVSGSFSREVVTYNKLFAFETEVGIGKRFGDLEAGEGWAALYFRWKAFPWNHILRTSIGVSTGVNFATKIDQVERDKSTNTSRVLHYLSPEITFGLPDKPDLDLVFRFHHRSGGKLPIFNNTSGAAQYQTVGVRYRW